MSRYRNYINGHVIALAGAISLHGGIAVWAIQPSEPIAIAQQVMQISMVAPSSVAQVKEKSEVEVKQDTPLKPDGIRKAKPKTEKKEQKKNDAEQNSASTPPTSGPQDKDAVEKVAARSDPVFNAEYLHNPAPVYPAAARRSGSQGKVLLEVSVNPQGTANEVVVDTSSGSSLLDRAALDAVRQWRFIPAKRGSEIVEAKVIVPVEFKLN
jgi:protein TonB